MANSYTSLGTRGPRAGTPPGLTSLGAAVAMGFVGAAGGVVIGALQEWLTASDLLGAEYYWSAVLTGNALVLGFGWATLALWQSDRAEWLRGAITAAGLALLAALIGSVATKLGVELKMGFLVVAAAPALVAGLWLARRYAGATAGQLGVYSVAGIAWLLISWVIAAILANQPTPNTVPIPDSIPLWLGEIIWWLDVPLVLAAPLMPAVLSRRGAIKKGLDLLLLAAGFLVLPLALAGCFAVTVHLIPD